MKVLEYCVPAPWQCFRICASELTRSKSLLELAFFSAICHAPCILILEDIHRITTSLEAVAVRISLRYFVPSLFHLLQLYLEQTNDCAA